MTRLYVFTDFSADLMLESWIADLETPCLVEYYDDGSWTAVRPKVVKENGYTLLLPENEAELRYAPWR